MIERPSHHSLLHTLLAYWLAQGLRFLEQVEMSENILVPWGETCEAIAFDPLTRVMSGAVMELRRKKEELEERREQALTYFEDWHATGSGYPYGSPGPLLERRSINYIHIDMLRVQAQLLQAIEEEQGFVPSERSDNPNPCREPAEYLVPDAVQHSSGGLDIEIRPAWFCRTHLTELLVSVW